MTATVVGELNNVGVATVAVGIGGGVEVAAVDPIASMQAVENPELGEVAEQIQAKLRKVIESL